MARTSCACQGRRAVRLRDASRCARRARSRAAVGSRPGGRRSALDRGPDVFSAIGVERRRAHGLHRRTVRRRRRGPHRWSRRRRLAGANEPAAFSIRCRCSRSSDGHPTSSICLQRVRVFRISSDWRASGSRCRHSTLGGRCAGIGVLADRRGSVERVARGANRTCSCTTSLHARAADDAISARQDVRPGPDLARVAPASDVRRPALQGIRGLASTGSVRREPGRAISELPVQGTSPRMC